MPARAVRIERHNVRRPPTKNNLGAACAICGQVGLKIDLIEQRGQMVNRTHDSCYDDPFVYQGVLGRPASYGRQP